MVRGVIYLFEYGVALLRIFLLISLVCFIPRLFVIRSAKLFLPIGSTQSVSLQYGSDMPDRMLDLIKQWYPQRQQVKVGVITTNQDYKNIDNVVIDTLWQLDSLMDLPNNMFADQVRKLCADHDIIFLDIASSGLSYVALCHLLFDLLDNAATGNIPVVLFDRPNELGKKIEGPVCSFMRGSKCFKLALRHGMTIAELAHYYNATVLENKAALQIIPLNNYDRADSLLHNMYDASCGQNMSVFTLCRIIHQIIPQTAHVAGGHHNCIMLPPETVLLDQQWYELQALLKECGVSSFLYRYSDIESGGMHRGLKLDNLKTDEVDYFRVILAVIDFFKTAGVAITFSEHFDRIIGTPLVRQYAKGMISKKKLFACINKDLELFYRSAFAHFMYYPLPQLSLM